MLLSVAPTTVDDVLDQPDRRIWCSSAPTGKAVATDNNGDFVVTWQQYDANGAGGGRPTSTPATIPTPFSGSICRRASADTIALQYNGNAVEKISISAETKPFTSVGDAANHVAGSFNLTYTDPLSGTPYTGIVGNFDENEQMSGNAVAIQTRSPIWRS